MIMSLAAYGTDYASAVLCPTCRVDSPATGVPEEEAEATAAIPASRITCNEHSASGLTPEEEELLERLKERDQEVRTHEEAHRQALGQYAVGAPLYTFQQGPDGRMYAVGGKIAACIGPEATPEETRHKARILKNAAIGVVADPSPADAAIAAHANRMALQASSRSWQA